MAPVLPFDPTPSPAAPRTPPPRRILITGANGFVGRHLVRQLRARGDTVIEARGPAAAGEPGADHDPSLRIEITDAESVRRAVEQARPDGIIHLAGFASVGRSHHEPVATFAINAQGTVHLLQAARALGTGPRMLLVSSGEVYGGSAGSTPVGEDTPLAPLSPYAASKVAAEVAGAQFARSYGLPVVIARPFNHLGRGQQPAFVVPSFARQLKAIARGADPVVRVGDLTPVRDFSHVDDVVAAYLLLLERGAAGEAYNIASGEGRTIRSVLEELRARSKVEATIEVDPARLRAAELPVLIGDAARLRLLGWRPERSVGEALQDVLDELDEAG